MERYDTLIWETHMSLLLTVYSQCVVFCLFLVLKGGKLDRGQIMVVVRLIRKTQDAYKNMGVMHSMYQHS